MKSIIIFGEPRCGKSTLTNMIVDKFNYQLIRVDAIRGAFKTIYPELNIAPGIAMNNEKFQLFLQEYLDRNTEKEERNKYGYVMEGCETSVEDCNKLYNNGSNIIYYLGTIDVSPKEFFDNIRKNDGNKDWTYDLTDEELMQEVNNIISRSKNNKQQCEKYNIPFRDTSCDRKEKLNCILMEIEEKLKQL